MAVVLRIKFPPTYPLIYKTLRIDKELTVSQAIEFISETLHVAAGENIGIFIPQQNEWLDNDTKLKDYPVLEDAEEVEFKDKTEVPPEPEGGGGSTGCCSIM